MIGERYWSTGIAVAYAYAGGGDMGWAAQIDYNDNGFCNDDADAGVISTEGILRTRYSVRDGAEKDALTAVIDVIRADAERLGIGFPDAVTGPFVYYKGDGEDPEFPPPDGWREMLAAQAERIGWRVIYATSATECES